MIRLAIIDDHPVARRDLERILSEVREAEVAISAGSHAEFAQALTNQTAPDVVILDLYLEGEHPSLATVREISAAARVLAMSANGLPADVLGVVRAGASGYVIKDSSPELIVSSVETVAAGGFSLSSQLLDILQEQVMLSAPQRSGHAEPQHPEPARPALSPREEETLDYISRGFTHAQIATRMGVRKPTVDTYVERIRVKLRVGNKAELTRAALLRPQFRPDT